MNGAKTRIFFWILYLLSLRKWNAINQIAWKNERTLAPCGMYNLILTVQQESFEVQILLEEINICRSLPAQHV